MKTKEFFQKYGIWIGILLIVITLFTIFMVMGDNIDKNIPDKFDISCPGNPVIIDAGGGYYKKDGKYYATVITFAGGQTREITKNEYFMAYDEYKKRCNIKP